MSWTKPRAGTWGRSHPGATPPQPTESELHSQLGWKPAAPNPGRMVRLGFAPRAGRGSAGCVPGAQCSVSVLLSVLAVAELVLPVPRSSTPWV